MAYSYFESENIEVYPSAFRGTVQVGDDEYMYNVESASYTERNHSLYSYLNKDTYIITDKSAIGVNKPLELLIHGYYFKIIKLPQNLLGSAQSQKLFAEIKLGLRIKNTSLGNGQSTGVLSPFEDTSSFGSNSSILDVNTGTTTYFYGLAMLSSEQSIPVNTEEYAYFILDLNQDEDKLFGKVKNIDLENNIIETKNIKDDVITTAKIKNQHITTEKIKDKSVVNSKIADNAVETRNILDQNVTNDKIAEKTILGDRIADNVINTNHIIDDAITNSKLADNAVETNNIKDSNVTYEKLGSKAIQYKAEKDVIDTGAIRSHHIYQKSILTEKINDKAVTTEKVNDQAITADKLAINSILTDKIKNGSVTTEKLANDAYIYGAQIIVNSNGAKRYTEPDKLLYLNDGQIIESRCDIGSQYNPVYILNGEVRSISRTGSYSNYIVGLNNDDLAEVKKGIIFNNNKKLYISNGKLYSNISLNLQNYDIEGVNVLKTKSVSTDSLQVKDFTITNSIICKGSPSIKLNGNQKIIIFEKDSTGSSTYSRGREQSILKSSNDVLRLKSELKSYSSCDVYKNKEENDIDIYYNKTVLNKPIYGNNLTFYGSASTTNTYLKLNPSSAELTTNGNLNFNSGTSYSISLNTNSLNLNASYIYPKKDSYIYNNFSFVGNPKFNNGFITYSPTIDRGLYGYFYQTSDYFYNTSIMNGIKSYLAKYLTQTVDVAVEGFLRFNTHNDGDRLTGTLCAPISFIGRFNYTNSYSYSFTWCCGRSFVEISSAAG